MNNLLNLCDFNLSGVQVCTAPTTAPTPTPAPAPAPAPAPIDQFSIFPNPN